MSRFAETRLFLGYVGLVVRPGSAPPEHPRPMERLPVPPDDWTDSDLDSFIGQAQRTIEGQQADKRDIRGRAQVVLTTTFVVGGVAATSGQHAKDSWWWWLIYLAGLGLVAMAGLASAGILTGRSVVGTPSVENLLLQESGHVKRQIATEYSAVVHFGANTVAVLVTVLRSTVTCLVLAFGLSLVAYLTRN